MDILTNDTLAYVFGLLTPKDQFYIGCFLRPRLSCQFQRKLLARLPGYSDEEGVIEVSKLAQQCEVEHVDARLIEAIQQMDYPVRGLCLNGATHPINETMLIALHSPLTVLRLALHSASLPKNILESWHAHKSLGQTLERFSLTHYGINKVPDPQYDEMFLQFMMQASSSLTHLSLKQSSISDAVFAESMFWPTLRSLQLSNMPNMTGSCYRQLARNAPELRHLELADNVATTHLWHFRHHPSLHTLVLAPPSSRRSCLFILPELLSTLTSLRTLVIRAPTLRLKRAFLDEIVQHQSLRFVQHVSWTFGSSYLTSTLGDMPALTHLDVHLNNGLTGHDNVLDLTTAPNLQHLTLHLLTLNGPRRNTVPFELRTSSAQLERCHLDVSDGAWTGYGPYLDLHNVSCDTLRLTLNLNLLERIVFPRTCRRLELNVQQHHWQQDERHAGYILCLDDGAIEGLREVILERSGIHESVRIDIRTDPTVTVSE